MSVVVISPMYENRNFRLRNCESAEFPTNVAFSVVEIKSTWL